MATSRNLHDASGPAPVMTSDALKVGIRASACRGWRRGGGCLSESEIPSAASGDAVSHDLPGANPPPRPLGVPPLGAFGWFPPPRWVRGAPRGPLGATAHPLFSHPPFFMTKDPPRPRRSSHPPPSDHRER